VDIKKALTFVTEDDRWIIKILIGGVLVFLSFLIIPILFVQGYLVHIVRNVMDGVEEPLPEWEQWGKLLKDGFNLTVAGLVYTLPIWLLMCCSFMFFIPAAVSEGGVAEIMAAIGVTAMVLMSCLLFLFIIAFTLIEPAITIQYAREDSLSACFRFSEVLGMTRDNIADIIIAVAIILGLSFVLSLVGIVPIIGWIISIFASVYVIFVSGHLFGQIGTKVGGAPKEKEVEPAI
jgi:hypothetical protein